MNVTLAFDDSLKLKVHKLSFSYKMEELKEKFAKQVAFIDKMRENIIINSNNFEILKTMTLSINQKVLKLESVVENNQYIKQNDMIAKKFEKVKNKKIELNNFWSEKIQTLENKTKDDKEHFKDVIMKKASEAENLIKLEQLKLKELFEEKKQKIK